MKRCLGKLGVCLMVAGLSYSVAQGEVLPLSDFEKIQNASNEIALYINDEQIQTLVMPPVQIDGRVLVPAREVFSTLGAYVDWKAAENKVYVEYEDTLMVLEINQKEVWVNGEIKVLDAPAQIINGKVMIPLRFIGETLGFHVDWQSSTSSVFINNNVIEPNNGGLTDDMNGNNAINNSVYDNINGYDDMYLNDYEMTGEEEPIYVDNMQLSEQMSYEAINNILVLRDIEEVNVEDIEIENYYRDRRISVTLPDTVYLEEAVYQLNLGHLVTLTVKNGNELVLETSSVCEITLIMEQDDLCIKLVKPKEKYEKIIVLDAGHGGTDPGTSYEDILEKDLTLSYSKALYDLLAINEGIKVYVTRDQDVYPTLQDRVNLSNEIEPDLYISIHINSVESNEQANGTETLYTEVKGDNRGKTFAKMVQSALVDRFGTRDRGIKDNGLYVTRMTNDPAILIEAGFLTNPSDRMLMTSDSYPYEYAQVIYRCILDYYNAGFANQN